LNADLVREIQDKIDIIELISETTELTRKGNRYWGLCPFHSEKTPSFSVSADRQLFYCFGCHTGGNVFTFVMKRDNIEFGEALEVLAERAGINSARFTAKQARRDKERDRILEINEAAVRFYHQALLREEEGREARQYLTGRGITPEAMTRFELGYAPNDWRRLMDFLLRKGYAAEHLVASGLVKRSQNGDTYFDMFRSRVIFPIRDQAGRVVGMGGRSLDDSNQPKYLNTPETRVFSKRHNLYGLFHARELVRRLNEAILVEGYMDCVKLQQYGIGNVVASLGTAFTREQARLLKRYCERVVIIFDGDEAGQRETLATIEVLNSEGVTAEAVVLPGGQDPDEYIEACGKEEFLRYIKNYKKNTIEFRLDQCLKEGEELGLSGKLAILREFYPELAGLESQLELDNYLLLMARKLAIPEHTLYRDFAKWRRQPAGIGIIRNINSTIRYNKEISLNKPNFQERLLARMLNEQVLFYHIDKSLGINFFSNDALRRIAALHQKRLLAAEEGREEPPDRWVALEPDLEAAYARLSLVEERDFPSDHEVEEFIKRVKMLKRERKWKRLIGDIRDLRHKGDFLDILRVILKVDTYIRSQEGGRL